MASSASMRIRWLSRAESSVSRSSRATTCLKGKSAERMRAAWRSCSLRASSKRPITFEAVASSALTCVRALRSTALLTANTVPTWTRVMRIRNRMTTRL
jgi:hypothetical protein